MIIYNVTIKVEKGIAEEWVKWMKEEHMPELLQTGLFTHHKLHHLLEQDETEDITYIAQYYLACIENYNAYISRHAQKMREQGLNRFGNRFIAFRTIMEEVE
jgi:hypothetical protein